MRYTPILPMRDDQTVKEQFGWLPVSVFKPERKPDWDAIIGDGGDETTTRRSADAKYLPNLRFSKFHPHLAEMVIRYWSLEGDKILDPFAGRGTRGIVARRLGRVYDGYEISPATYSAWSEKLSANGATLHLGDGCTVRKENEYDLIFTCPPYHRLEKYEDVPGQLSSILGYETFVARLSSAALDWADSLKVGRFLCWVCADWRDGKAFRCFHQDSIRFLSVRGLVLHDIVIVHNNSPFAPLQAAKVAAKRYTSKVHEYLLVFRKASSVTN